MLHGSEGSEDFPGSIGTFAQTIAKEGFVVLELCWFGCKDTPAIIRDVPLDRTIAAAQWLKGTKEVSGKKIGLFGWSRGGEQAVLIGASVKQTDLFTAIAAHAPSDTIVCAFDPNDEYRDIFDTDPATGQRVWAAAWTFHGTKLFGEKGMPFGSGPRIEVESYPGPMWISHGEADTLWPVDRSKHIVAARDKVAGLVTEPHYWQGEDHAVAGYTAADQKEWLRLLVDYFKAKIATP
jgi:dienelactone hydrolase